MSLLFVNTAKGTAKYYAFDLNTYIKKNSLKLALPFEALPS